MHVATIIDGPARAAGIRAGDTIVASPILQAAIQSGTLPPKPIRLTLERDSRAFTVSVTPSRLYSEFAFVGIVTTTVVSILQLIFAGFLLLRKANAVTWSVFLICCGFVASANSLVANLLLPSNWAASQYIAFGSLNYVFYGALGAAIIALGARFPDGNARPLPAKLLRRPVLVCVAASVVAFYVMNWVVPGQLILLASSVLGAALFVDRFARSVGEERMRLRWALAGITLTALQIGVYIASSLRNSDVQ